MKKRMVIVLLVKANLSPNKRLGMYAIKPFVSVFLILFSFHLKAQTNVTDTVFIQKDSVLGTAQSIYFDNNPQSKFYNYLDSWDLRDIDQDSYNVSLKSLKATKQSSHKRTPVIPVTKWINLMQYKGKYYAYKPCDFMYLNKVSINESTYIDWSGEGKVYKILDQKKGSKNAYQFELSGDRNIIIHIINTKRGIAIFEDKLKGEKPRYYLMISSDKIRSVPLIVNYCETNKQGELKFEEPDFKDLLKQADKKDQ